MKRILLSLSSLLLSTQAIAAPLVLSPQDLGILLKGSSENTLKKIHDGALSTSYALKIVSPVAPHKHLRHDEFFTLHKGSGTLFLKHKGKVVKYKVKAGFIFHIPRATEHAYRPDAKTNYGVSVFSPQWSSDRHPVKWNEKDWK